MKFFRYSTPLPRPSIDVQTDASSDALSDLLAQLNEIQEHDTAPPQLASDTIFLNTENLVRQGKMHKNKILSNWVACQTFLTQVELDSRAKQVAFRVQLSGDESNTFSDTTSRSGMTSRTSTSLTLPRTNALHFTRSASTSAIKSLQPTKKKLSTLPRFMKRSSSTGNKCQGFQYESYSNASNSVYLVHDDSARVEEEWAKLDAAWRSSLYLVGPRATKKVIPARVVQ